MSSQELPNNLTERVARVLAEEVAPALQMDGHALEVVEVAHGVARLRITGACSGCPGTVMAIIAGIEAELCRRVPEVQYVELTV
jgi:Fe-S cluster biogenesis protein NfuA